MIATLTCPNCGEHWTAHTTVCRNGAFNPPCCQYCHKACYSGVCDCEKAREASFVEFVCGPEGEAWANAIDGKAVRVPTLSLSTNDASRTLLYGSEDRCERPSLSVGPTVIGTGQHSAGRVSPKLVSLGTSATTLLIITALALFASGICPSVCWAQSQSGILDGSLIERIERRADRIEARLQESTHEARRWNDFVERWEARFDKWDGSRISALLANLFAPFAWVVQVVKLAFYALIAVCVARSIRELSETFRPWFARAKPA